MSIEKVLNSKALPSFYFTAAVIAVAVALSKLVAVDHAHAMDAAREVIQPLERDVQSHLQETKALRPVMMQTAETLKEATERNARNQYKICLKLRIDCEQP